MRMTDNKKSDDLNEPIMIEFPRYEYAVTERDRYRSMCHRLAYAIQLIHENIEDGMPKQAMLLSHAMLEDYKDFLLDRQVVGDE